MLPTLAAEAQLRRIEAAAVPHMRAASQRDVIRRLSRTAGTPSATKRATAGDLAAMGIAVEEVPG